MVSTKMVCRSNQNIFFTGYQKKPFKSYGLDHHIPTRLNNNRIHTEFEQFYQGILKVEQFYQGILKDISHLLENYLSSLKTKLRNACEKYSKIYVPYKYKKIIDQLSGNKDLCILKQDKDAVLC